MATTLWKNASRSKASAPLYLTWRRLGFRTFCVAGVESLSQLRRPPSSATSPAPGVKVLESFTEEFEIGSETITLETGKLARFANGSVVIGMGETKVLSTVASSKVDGARDFLPLTVDYQEKQYAHGVIPTTFMRREGAPKERELLCGRIIDRPIRPLFPTGFYHEVQVTASVLSSDGQQDPDVMAANATSAALMLSDIPWEGPIGVIRVGRIDGKFVFNPTMVELSLSDLNLIYACTRDKTLMIDVQAREISEKDLEAGLRLAHPEAVKYIDPQIRLAAKVGKKKKEYRLSMITDGMFQKIKQLSEDPIRAVFTDSSYGKFERGEALDKITQNVKAKLEEENDEETLKVLPKAIDTVRKMIVRRRIIEEGHRVDGRQLEEVRPLYCEAGTFPILHGSSLFSRGDTQVLCTVTLGTPRDAQRLDSLVGPPTKRFMLHYSFPPFSINEVGKRMGLNRREVGHGTLAEKALLAVLPPEDEFPYAVRVNSEVMASDGSTSMATVCGGSMALMDAGIPLREHVAGISVGLVSEVDSSTGLITDYRILTDILGLEDHLGDMDFKIAGTRNGITAIQLDIKPSGIPLDIICECLEPARNGRAHILDRMELAIGAPRNRKDENALRLATLKLSEASLRRLLPYIKKIEKETGARIAVNEGSVTIVAKNQSFMEKAESQVFFLVGREIEVGSVYKGIISSIKEFGAFVEFNGGQQGLLHISELSHEKVSKVSDVVSVGKEVSVMCLGQDVRGNIKLSLKAAQPNKLGSKTKDSEVEGAVLKKAVNVWAAANTSPPTLDDDESPSPESSNDEESHDPTESSTLSSLSSVIIRSAAECDAQDIASGLRSSKNSRRVTKTTPRPYGASQNSSSPSWEKSVVSSPTKARNKNGVTKSSTRKTKDDARKQTLESPASIEEGNTYVGAVGSLDVGMEVTAKVYQIRTHGLVLELGDGVRGMLKFEVNARRDFQAGEELLVKCTSFSSKGIPVFSLFHCE